MELRPTGLAQMSCWRPRQVKHQVHRVQTPLDLTVIETGNAKEMLSISMGTKPGTFNW